MPIAPSPLPLSPAGERGAEGAATVDPAPGEPAPGGPAPAEPAPGEPATADRGDATAQVGVIVAGKYKLLETLGQGGMGAVFMAQQTAPVKRLVALKLIKRGMDSRQVLNRFEAERQALALMDHPNIAKVLDAGTSESGSPFFVMELVKGVPITRFCDERHLAPRERLELFIPVCQAIQHAHQKGVIHRDIKPNNVLVALYDDHPVPKVIDFGVAKAAGSQLTDASLVTGFGAIVGTPEYMSPEQAQLNQLDIDTRSDVYALGVLLYELLTGSTPIDRRKLGQDALFEILRVIREDEPLRPSTRLSTSDAVASIAATRKTEPAKLANLLRGELDWIIMKCLEKDRARRYETANALARDLERYLHDEVVEAQPPSASYRLRKLVRKHRTALAMAATVVLLLVAGVAVSAWQAARAIRAEQEARDEQGKTAEALVVAKRNQQEADAQRQKAETHAAGLMVDSDLKRCEDGEIAVGVLGLAGTLRTMPEHAKVLRECVALNILAWGQRLARINGPLDHDGYALTQTLLSPDGRTICTDGRDWTVRLWDSVTGQQRAILPLPSHQILEFEFSSDGSTLLTIHGSRRRFSVGPDSNILTKDGGPTIVRLWDVATGKQRAATAEHGGDLGEVRLSANGSLLVTTCSRSFARPEDGARDPKHYVVFFWNASTGRLMRKLEVDGSYPSIDVRPDGECALIAFDGHFDVCVPDGSSPARRLPGDCARYSPSGKSAASVVNDTVYWWNASTWQPDQKVSVSDHWFDTAIIQVVAEDAFWSSGKTYIKSLSKPIDCTNWPRRVARTGRHLVIGSLVYDAETGHRLWSPRGLGDPASGSLVYDAETGQRLAPPRGRKFHPELSQLAADGRFTLTDDYIVDLAADRKIIAASSREHFIVARYVETLETWVTLESRLPTWQIGQRIVLRKSDARLSADLLDKWSEVITRGKLDDSGRFSKFDESSWEKARQELAQLLASRPDARSLRSAVTDHLYWLRREIKDTLPVNLSLYDRLIAAEPTWPNYVQRADANAKLQHWDQAIRDELEATRLAGERYWLRELPPDWWQRGAQLVKAPDRPREHYELVLRWAEAALREGVGGEPVWDEKLQTNVLGGTVIVGFAQYRLGRYADALATLRRKDVPVIAGAAGMLISPWNLLTLIHRPVPGGISNIRAPNFDPVDLMVRAMCHHHLGHLQEARACLQQLRRMHPMDVYNDPDQRAIFQETQTLIEGMTQPKR
jgi:serine/threonine protein kinase